MSRIKYWHPTGENKNIHVTRVGDHLFEAYSNGLWQVNKLSLSDGTLDVVDSGVPTKSEERNFEYAKRQCEDSLERLLSKGNQNV